MPYQFNQQTDVLIRLVGNSIFKDIKHNIKDCIFLNAEYYMVGNYWPLDGFIT